jgi:hypothetical protein
MLNLSSPGDLLTGFVGERVFAERSVSGPEDVFLESDIVIDLQVSGCNRAIDASNTLFD